MELVGLKVTHNARGVGVIAAKTDINGDTYITVEFADRVSKFVYPDAFEKFIKAQDDAVQQEIIDGINAARAAAEQQRQAEEAARKAAAERKAAEEAARRTSSGPVPVVRTQRIEGKRMPFFVFQGNTFERECQGGYIWAPISDRTGSTPHHWARMLDVREGDIILHGCNAHIQAISVTRGACYDCMQPAELVVEGLWEKDGRRVDCDYVRLNNPIKTSHFVSDIIRLSRVKYSPFDRDGNGNMGYLYEINRELARIFVEAAVKQNPYLGAIDYIADFLAEKDEE